jgi:hypothetical protein
VSDEGRGFIPRADAAASIDHYHQHHHYHRFGRPLTSGVFASVQCRTKDGGSFLALMRVRLENCPVTSDLMALLMVVPMGHSRHVVY